MNPENALQSHRCLSLFSLIILCLVASSCSIRPRYSRPTVPLATSYKESSAWKAAAPGDTEIRGDWWVIFQDSELNTLENRLELNNQNIAAAAARYAAARAIVKETRSGYFPSISTTPSIANSRIAASPYSSAAKGSTFTEYTLPFTVSWEPDLWARVRNSERANAYTAQARAADLQSATLLAHASLAAAYFEERGVEAQELVLNSTIQRWQNYLDLTRTRFRTGLENNEAVSAAESQLNAARAQASNLGIARAQYEHAIAILLGESPSTFTLGDAKQSTDVPGIPTAIPARLLERRPDIASAERAMAAANAQIGVSKSAYFPNITLTGTGGFESLAVADWLIWPSRFWSIGAEGAETIFDAGQRRAQVRQSQAFYAETVANYRQTVLTAFQQVEDNLAALRILRENLEHQQEAVRAANQYLTEANVRNNAGLDPYLNVLVAQLTLLSYQQTLVTFHTQQVVVSVQLIEALGGGWNIQQLPPMKKMPQP